MTTLDGAVDLARDRELVEQCQAGDEAAFAELYTRYQRRLHRFCLRRLHGADDADEAVQEAFARAWRALPRFAGERRFYPWLSVIAANVCTDILRRRSRVVPMDEMPWRAGDGDLADVDDKLMRSVDVAMATQAFGNLSERHRRVLQLREATEWSAQRIAEHEGLAVPAVDTLLWRARQAFKREFSALSEAGGLAGVAGIAMATLKRSISRLGARVAAAMPFPARGPGVLAAALALGGAAVVGGGVVLVGSGPAHQPSHPAGVHVPVAPPSGGGISVPNVNKTSQAATGGSTSNAGQGSSTAPTAPATTLPAGTPSTTWVGKRTPLTGLIPPVGTILGTGSNSGGQPGTGRSGILPKLTTPKLTLTPPKLTTPKLTLTTPKLTTPKLTTPKLTTPKLTLTSPSI